MVPQDRKVLGYVILTLAFRQEGRRWTGECLELGTATFGCTLKEVREEVLELVELHLDARKTQTNASGSSGSTISLLYDRATDGRPEGSPCQRGVVRPVAPVPARRMRSHVRQPSSHHGQAVDQTPEDGWEEGRTRCGVRRRENEAGRRPALHQRLAPRHRYPPGIDISHPIHQIQPERTRAGRRPLLTIRVVANRRSWQRASHRARTGRRPLDSSLDVGLGCRRRRGEGKRCARSGTAGIPSCRCECS